MDMQINSLSFSQSAEEKDVTMASISLKHCPRPGLMALLSAVTEFGERDRGCHRARQCDAAEGIAMSATAAISAWPDDSLDYSPLPASGDDGFPQVFLALIQQTVYRLTLSVYYADPDLVLGAAYANTMFDLPDPVLGLYLNLRAEFGGSLPAATRLIGARRVVLNMPIALGPLRFRFSRIRIAQANLAGPGSFGSALTADVAVANA